MDETVKEVVWLHVRVKTPPFSEQARLTAGQFIREIQEGRPVSMPHSRPMPEVGSRCHELRLDDREHSWRIIYRIDPAHVVVAAIFAKTTQETPEIVKRNCRARLRKYDLERRG